MMYVARDLTHILVPDYPDLPDSLWSRRRVGVGKDTNSNESQPNAPNAPQGSTRPRYELVLMAKLTPRLFRLIMAQAMELDQRYWNGEISEETLAAIAKRMRPIVDWANENIPVDRVKTAAIPAVAVAVASEMAGKPGQPVMTASNDPVDLADSSWIAEPLEDQLTVRRLLENAERLDERRRMFEEFMGRDGKGQREDNAKAAEPATQNEQHKRKPNEDTRKVAKKGGTKRCRKNSPTTAR